MPSDSVGDSPSIRTSSIDVDLSNSRRNLIKRGNTLNLEAGTPITKVGSQSQQPRFNLVSYLRGIPSAAPKYLRSLLKPADELGPIPNIRDSLWAIVKSSRTLLLAINSIVTELPTAVLNPLLIFIPVSV
jgi:hypothetical protein